MAEIRLVYEYEHSCAAVWRALTDPSCMRRWMVAAVPEGFTAQVGARFRFVGKPQPGWNGIVDCEVMACEPPTSLRYTWVTDPNDAMEVRYELEPLGAERTRFTFSHTGFRGVGGFLLARLFIGPIRKRMFGERIRTVLAEEALACAG